MPLRRSLDRTRRPFAYCKETGHLKRNYSKWLAEHGKKAENASSGKGTLVAYVIDIYLADIPSSSRVFDTGSAVHICNSMQGLVRTRHVAQGRLTSGSATKQELLRWRSARCSSIFLPDSLWN